MIKDLCKKHWEVLLVNILLLVIFVCFYGKFGDLNVDSFREAYIPSQILCGGVLYKNIFNVYAPFSYLFNAFWFSIFGVRLSVLYVLGFLTTTIILNIFYVISKFYIDKKYGLGIIVFTISASVLSCNVFNMIFPYSFGILYGILFAMMSLYFVLKGRYFGAYLMYSFAICSKYEFILILPLLIWISRKHNPTKNVIAFLIPVLITFVPLFVKGLNFNDLIISLQFMISTAASKSIHWFYSATGIIFRPQIIFIYAINLVKILIPLILVYYFRNWFIYLISFVYIYLTISQEVIIYILPLILILTIVRIHAMNKPELFFIAASLLISSKVFFALTLESYGVYFVPFALLSLFIACPKKYRNAIFVIILLCALSLGIRNIQKLEYKNIKISTEKGIFYTNSQYGEATIDLIRYVEKNTLPKDRICVYPEGLGINFLANRISDNKFYSLIPLYTEVFGENLIIQRIKFIKPEYIVISDYDTSNYYYSKFGNDYAKEIFKYIQDNYFLEKTFGDAFKYRLFRIKR